jgi:hypothetical protein
MCELCEKSRREQYEKYGYIPPMVTFILRPNYSGGVEPIFASSFVRRIEISEKVKSEIMKINYNSISPVSEEKLLTEYSHLREPNSARDDSYSPLFDTIMHNICEHLKIYGDQEIYEKMWTSNIFPERLSKAILRVVEEYIIRENLK